MPRLLIKRAHEETAVDFSGTPLLADALEAAGFALPRPCGGRGACGKCAVEVAGAVSEPSDAERALGMRLACQTVLLGDAEVALPREAPMEQIVTEGKAPVARAPMAGRLGAAIDIGTTTLALALYDLPTGARFGEATALNPQTSVAADVMGRISAAMNGGGEKLRDRLMAALDERLRAACASASRSRDEIDALVLTGNTTMLYLLTGRDPASLSRAPFAAECLFDFAMPLLGAQAYLPPCVSAFVGADAVCALLSTGLCDGGETALLCDVGTNGEIALWRDGRLFVTSTAAGPAFEGAGISCGVRSVLGAIDRVWESNGRLCAHTIGGGKAAGLCGSGLLDAVAALVRMGEIDETGATSAASFPLRDGVTLLPRDIRAVQLGKAAIAAGMQTLLERAGARTEDVGALYLAGGFGSRLDVRSAATIGLIPRALVERTQIVGNAALAGAATLLLDRGARNTARRIAREAVHVSLGGDPRFNERYVEQMLFV